MAARTGIIDGHWMWLDVGPRQQAHFVSLLAPQERDRAARYPQPRDRLRYVVARARLRELLAKRLGCRAREVVLGHSETGKPFVCGATLRFNVSHADDLALFVMADDLEIGCDIAWHNAALFTPTAERLVFSPSGLACTEKLSARQRVDAFFTMWTCKEALLKGEGSGLLRSPAELDVGIPPRPTIKIPGDEQEWSLYWRTIDRLHLAVAARSAQCHVNLPELPLRRLAA